jgi:hypothetical protein
MREVDVERFVAASDAEVQRALSPERIVEYEGSFEVRDVEKRDGETLVTAGARGLEMSLRFEDEDGGVRYEQLGEAGPFDEMWTRLTWERENEGVRIRAHSGVSLGLPLAAMTDRVAAWKRRGELKRALRKLAADLE